MAETVDCPNEIKPERKGNDTIKILEDTDGDGKADKVTVFADGLNIPTSLTFSRGGVIVAHAPDFLFLKDTDGDDVADVKEVLFSGWGAGDTHAGPSNLRYGFDNWIWGTVGYSAFNGRVGGKDHRFGMGVFRFKPDGSAIEFLHQFNSNTWGLGFNEAGDVFGSTANNNPSFFGGIRATAYQGKRGVSAKMIAPDRSFHPITPNIRQIDAFGNYTAGAGHALATSDAFPESYRDRIAFVAGPTGNLLGMYDITRDGAGFQAENAFAFVASADEWFFPVAAEVGPDGHLWIANWYNFIIQHNPTPNPGRVGYGATTGRGNAHVNPNRDSPHSRIYRAVWEKAPEGTITSLGDASTADLVVALDSDNLFWRQTAQRLLVDGQKAEAVAALKQRLEKPTGHGAIHALWTLEGLGSLEAETHQVALLSEDAAVRRNAILALGTDAGSVQLFFDTAVVTDADSLVRLAAFNKMSEFPVSDSIALAARQLMADPNNAEDEWLSQSLTLAGAAAVKKGPAKLGPNLLTNGSLEELEGDHPTGWKPRI
ncbi:MAG: hypothetical protein GWQ08_15310 [Verrucomicrobiaceae bacterium]|nr:hypothetical protein [Verrucomicrobiaceae bacterium]